MKRIFYVVNVDWFFISHRLPLALTMMDNGYEVYVLTKDTGRKKELESLGLKFISINFERSGKNPFKEISIIFQLLKYYRIYQPDIVHHVTIKPSIYGSISRRFVRNKRIKVVNAISGLGYNFIGERNGIFQRILKKLMRFAFTNVNFIFQNPDDLNLYKEMGLLEFNNYKIIKGAGVNSELFSYHSPVVKDKIYVVLPARMLRDKGIGEFIDAANILYEQWNGKALFILAGEIDLDNLAGITEIDLRLTMRTGYLEWIGYKKDIKSLLISADIVCLPSYREGLPKSLIEAMAIGRPIVTTDVPGCRECVDEGVNGFMVPPQDAISLSKALCLLLNDGLLRQEMGVASRRKMLNELSLKKVIDDTIKFYEDIKI